jgi:hypothetical protein
MFTYCKKCNQNTEHSDVDGHCRECRPVVVHKRQSARQLAARAAQQEQEEQAKFWNEHQMLALLLVAYEEQH